MIYRKDEREERNEKKKRKKEMGGIGEGTEEGGSERERWGNSDGIVMI